MQPPANLLTWAARQTRAQDGAGGRVSQRLYRECHHLVSEEAKNLPILRHLSAGDH